MEKKIGTEKKKKEGDVLLELVLSWSFTDIFNKNLFKSKVMKIPDKFSSDADYLSSFKQPLIEETRASLCSALEAVGKAPACEISHLKPFRLKSETPKKLLGYNIVTKPIEESENPDNHYEPESGDLVLLTNARLGGRDYSDILDNNTVIASVLNLGDSNFYKFRLLLANEIGPELMPKKPNRVYATYLVNMTTNARIWRALNPNPKTSNLKIIQKVLQYDSTGDKDCIICLGQQIPSMLNLIDSFKLDESQTNAVLSSISMSKCPHEESNVKLIWGPPGTGKTRTVASLLFALLKSSCRTLTCAPTNIAVLQVAERLMSLVLPSLDHDTYGLGDIVLFGNKERMKVDDHNMLVDVFLDYRVDLLLECTLDWRPSLQLMISFLEDPEGKYSEYVQRHRGPLEDKKKAKENDKGSRKNKKEQPKHLFEKSLKEIRKESKQKGKKNEENSNAEMETEPVNLMTYLEFMRKTFYSLADRLMFCTKNLYTHLPTSSMPLVVAKQMIRLSKLLKRLENVRNNDGDIKQLKMKKEEILKLLKLLQKKFPHPIIEGKMKDFCLSRACLVFCTASSSIKVESKVKMVVIDEAAQLKECESAIPLQVPGARYAILIGDDRQLPAMVQSKVSESANFGRSLFQRLATLGKEKHLLNIQYRMHPTISVFPNREFYDNKIVDGPNVKDRSYERNFLKEMAYGSYSFIHVAQGKEDFSKGHSPRNLKEATVVVRIIEKLFKEHCIKKQKVSVGVISPYKGQVGLIEEKLGKKYKEHKETGFSVSVRSVDGFQGGEEDIIIISTVRSNKNGSVGFLSNHQRTNVALTRARYCLWIVGNGMTLVNSGSVWKDLVIDAMTRGYFCNAEESSYFGGSLKLDILKLGKTRWKVFFSDDFEISIARLTKKSKKRAMEMVKKLADGWRQPTSMKVVDSELLEQYKVDDGQLYLAWSTDIVEEESKYTQVIRVWDILPASWLPNLAKKLNVLFKGYTTDVLNRCKHKSSEGNLVLPKSWPIRPVWVPRLEANPAECLARRLAAMNLKT